MAKRGNFSLDDVWEGTKAKKGLKQSIEEIFLHNFPKQQYMTTYTDIYNYCTASKGSATEQPRSTRGRGGRARRGTPRGTESSSINSQDVFIGGELYRKLRDVIRNKVNSVFEESKKVNGFDILTYYQKSWKAYKFSIRVLNGVASYLNKHWVQREREERGGEEGPNPVYEIYSLGIIEWREGMYRRIQISLLEQIMRVIQKERDDETDLAHQLLLKTIIQESLVELGLFKRGTHPGKAKELDLAVYQEGFEKRFLIDTERYYLAESTSFIDSHSLVDYLIKSEKRFEEEARRVTSYLDSSTGSQVEKTLVKVLIEEHINRIHDEFKALVQQCKVDDLKRLYSLVKKADKYRSDQEKAQNKSIMDPMRETFKDHVTSDGTSTVDSVKGTATSDPKTYIDAVLSVYQKFLCLVTDAFENDSGFTTQLDRAASKFVNSNAVCESKSSRSAELLARYTDSFLKKNSKSSSDDTDKDRAMSEVITIFKFIEEKDVFLEFYSKCFGNRLVKEISASEDHEEMMIEKLKTECGHEYTSKLTKMFKDIALSRTLTEEFKTTQRNSEPSKVDFTIKILTTGHWNYKPTNDFALPKEIDTCKDRFLQFYSDKYSGRKLQWIMNHSRGEIKFFPRPSDPNFYIFTTTTHQLSILCLFNLKDTYEVTEIHNLTEIEIENDYLYKVIAQLLKTKIVTCSSRSDMPTGSDKISVNDAYKSKKKKMNISQPIKQEVKTEAEQTVKKVVEDRGLQTQAAIVRIMKMRRRLNHNNLVAAVVEQLQSRFMAKIPLIKKQIEVLVEKEYIARVEGERDTYEYLA